MSAKQARDLVLAMVEEKIELESLFALLTIRMVALGILVPTGMSALSVGATTPGLPATLNFAASGTPSLSPIDWTRLDLLLSTYHDRIFIVEGCRFGFKLGYRGGPSSTEGKNALSVRQNTKEVFKKINAERELARIAGPFKSKPFSPFKCSPLSLRPKSTPGKFRLLHDLSSPHNHHAVNACIRDEDAKVTYASVIDAIKVLVGMEGAYLAKGDLKDAYRQIPLAPDQYWLVGFKVQGSYFHDCRLPMGARSSCAIFERFASSLQYILENHYRVRHVIKMLDDFLFIGASEEECYHGLASFQHLCSSLNLPLAEEKTVYPSRQVVFLGIFLDAEAQLASIPYEKTSKYANHIDDILRKKSISLGSLREITGKLEHVTAIIKGGKAFLRRLHSAKCGVQQANRRILLSDPLREDLKLWTHFLKTYNSRTLFSYVLHPRSSAFILGSDASKKGFGGYWGRRCIAGRFPSSWSHLDIQTLELYPILALVGSNADDMRLPNPCQV